MYLAGLTMRPDYAYKLFGDKRNGYALLMQALAGYQL
jgi:hypothetical protein